ncbi:MAG: DNA-processing protein DprA [Mariprofundaceae bacterium]
MQCSDAAIAYLRLVLARGIGPRTGRQLVSACGSIHELWSKSDKELRQIEGVGPKLVTSLKGISQKDIELILQQCKNANIQLLCLEDKAYPKALKACEDAPLLLFVQGDVSALNSQRMLAIVGARKASRESRLIARRWSAYCSKLGTTIVSGMAYGVDAAAHGGALEGASPTVAVLGCGLGALSESQQRQVEAIAAQGCVVSEFLPDTTARPENFPQRNRIIAALSQAIVVIEAGLRSGSMITANQALSYGRDVFAVPGSVLNDAHAGCHQLIRDGAGLVDSAEALLQLLGWTQHIEKPCSIYTPANNEESKILEALKQEIMHLDNLADACCLTVTELSPSLLALELQGVIERMPGSRYTLGGQS